MNFKFRFGLILNCWAFFANAQQFQPLPPGFGYHVYDLYADTSTNLIYASGNFNYLADSTPAHGIATWDGATWNTAISNDVVGQMRSVVNFNGTIYTSGFTGYNIGGTYYSGIGVWNGINYQVIPLSTSPWDVVFTLHKDQNDLFACGLFNEVNGVQCDNFARFDGSVWHGYPSMNLYANQYAINSCIIYQNDLYIGGNFYVPNGSMRSLARFNGTNWVQVSTWPFVAGSLDVAKLYQWNNNLYIGGYFDTNMGTVGNGIVGWNGTNFFPLGAGFIGNVFDIIDYNNELYVCGSMYVSNNPNINFVAKWDGTQWYSIGTFNNTATSFAKMNNKLYIGGGFLSVNGAPMNFVTMYDALLGVNESDKTYTGIKTYPNPFTSSITVTTTGSQVQKALVTDDLGRVVFEKYFSSTTGLENNFFELCLEDLTPGIYNLTTESKNKRESKIIVKQ